MPYSDINIELPIDANDNPVQVFYCFRPNTSGNSDSHYQLTVDNTLRSQSTAWDLGQTTLARIHATVSTYVAVGETAPASLTSSSNAGVLLANTYMDIALLPGDKLHCQRAGSTDGALEVMRLW